MTQIIPSAEAPHGEPTEVAGNTFNVPSNLLPSRTLTREQYYALGGMPIDRARNVTEEDRFVEDQATARPPHPMKPFSSGEPTPRL